MAGLQQAKCRAGGLVTGGMQAFLGRGDVEIRRRRLKVLPMGLLRLVRCRWASRLSWVWFVVDIYQRGCMPLRLRMLLPLPLVRSEPSS